MNQVLVIHAPVDSYRRYSVKEQLTERNCEHSQISESCGPVCSEIARMRGVEICSLTRYTVTVHKADAFTWEEVEPTVVNFLNFFCESQGPTEEAKR